MGFFSKSTDKNNEDDRWKHKYLDLLDAQEVAEKACKLDQELLCKTIGRLSIILSKTDPQLEPYLQPILDQIKKGVDSKRLKQDLESLTTALTRLDTENPDKADNDKGLALFFTFLQGRYHSEPQQQKLGALQKSYQLTDNKENLFSGIIQFIDDESRVEFALNESVQTEPQFPEQPDYSEAIKIQMARLLENIEIPESFVDQAEELKQQLQAPRAIIPLDGVWDALTTLIIEINAKNQTKQQEIDMFLNHITAQLAALGLNVTDSGLALMDASLSRSQFDQSVSEQMDDLQHRSSNATQLEPLKQVISSHIAKITKEIQEHKQKEASQREKYQCQLDELSQKIKAMELETGELQTKLIKANTSAQRDVLTELPNRLAYDERLKMEVARWQRYHTPLCLAVMDIDFFKKINDSHGHQAGDKVLGHVAAIFTQNIRRSDFVARFGGEEFVMLFPHTNKHSALKVMDKLRLLIQQNHLQVQDTSIAISISGGVTQFVKGDTHESAFERADQALYQAKEQGRNRCCSG